MMLKKSWVSRQCKFSWLRWWLTFDLIDKLTFENLCCALQAGAMDQKFTLSNVSHSDSASLKSFFFGAEFFCLSHSFVQFRCRSLTWPFGDSHGFGAACASASSCTMLVSIADIDGLLGISHDCCSKKGCCSETQALDSEEKTLCCGAHSSSTWFHGKWSQMGPEVQASISGRSHFEGKIRPDVPSDSVWLSAVGILAEALLLLNISVDWSVWSWWKVSLIWSEIY